MQYTVFRPEDVGSAEYEGVSHHLLSQPNSLIYRAFGVAQGQWLTPIELLV